MTISTSLKRRHFLGALALVPLATSGLGCLAPKDDEDDGSPSRQGLTPVPDTAYKVNLKTDCLAKGDGATNDTAAFQEAAKRLKAKNGGTLIIPPGTYIVGNQRPAADSTEAYYQYEEIFSLAGVTGPVVIQGNMATLRVKRGLRYGGFDRVTGAPTDYAGVSPQMADKRYAAEVGRILQLEDCADVTIVDLVLDGSAAYLKLGGTWGDKDRQCSATGISLNRCGKATVTNVWTNHHALDGIAVLHRKARPLVKKPHVLTKVISEYNGRQGISWIGGWGLECTDCKFNHTGRVINVGGGRDDNQPLVSAPAAGLDIEPNAAEPDEISRDGVFTRCQFIDNAGAGMLADVGDGGYSTFVDCVFWGTDYYSVWPNRPGLVFQGCKIYGTAIHLHDGHTGTSTAPNAALATRFEDCTFEDKPWTDGTVQRAGYLYDAGNGATGATFDGCTFTTHEVRGVYMGGSTAEVFVNCTFVHGNTSLASGSYQSTFTSSKITSCTFTESSAISAGSKVYYVAVTNVIVGQPASGDPATTVSSKVKWNSAGSTGKTGTIGAGYYA